MGQSKYGLGDLDLPDYSNINWVDDTDFSSGTNWVDDSGYGAGGDFTTSYGDLGTHFFGPDTYQKPGYKPEPTPNYNYFNPGERIPGEQPSMPFKGPAGGSYIDAMRSWWSIPQQFFNDADTAGKNAARHVQEGQYGEVMGDIASPFTNMLKPGIEAVANYANQPTPKYEMDPNYSSFNPGERIPGEPYKSPISKVIPDPAGNAGAQQAKQQIIHQVVGLTGAPVEQVMAAWDAGNYEALLGHTTMAVLTAGLGHAVGKAFEKPPLPQKAAPIGPTRQDWYKHTTPQDIYGPHLDPSAYPGGAGEAFYGTRDPIYGQQELFPDTTQGDLNFGAYQGVGGRFTREGPGRATRMGPEVGEVPPQSVPEAPWLDFNAEQGDLFGGRPPATGPLSNEALMKQGWRRSPSGGLVYPESTPALPRVSGGETPVDLAPPAPAPPAPAPAAEPTFSTRGGVMTVPNAVANGKFIANAAENGWQKVSEGPEGTTFKKTRGGTSAGMFYSPEAAELIRNGLRKLFGREPTEAEVQTAAQGVEEGQQPREGGMTITSRAPDEQPRAQEGTDYRVRTDLPMEEDWATGEMRHPTEWIQPERPATEVLPPEPTNDIFGYPADRDLTPMEVRDVQRGVNATEQQYYPDDAEFASAMDESAGIVEGELAPNTGVETLRQQSVLGRGEPPPSVMPWEEIPAAAPDPPYAPVNGDNIREIREARTVEELNPIADHWLNEITIGNRQGNAVRRHQAILMNQRVNERMSQLLQESGRINRMQPPGSAPQREAVRADLDAIIDGSDLDAPGSTGVTQQIREVTNSLLSTEPGTMDVPATMARIREIAQQLGIDVDTPEPTTGVQDRSGRVPSERESNYSTYDRDADLVEVRDVDNLTEAVRLRDDWRREVSGHPDNEHARDMLRRAEERVNEIDARDFGRQYSQSGTPIGDRYNIDRARTVEEATSLREQWREEGQRQREAGENTDHAYEMWNRAQARVVELVNAESAPAHSDVGARRAEDIRVIRNTLNTADLDSMWESWRSDAQALRSRDNPDMEAINHAQEMMDLINQRTRELEQNGVYEIIGPDGGVVARRATAQEAIDYLDAVPDRSNYTYRNTQATQGLHNEIFRNEPDRFEVRDRDGSEAESFPTRQEAEQWIAEQQNPQHYDIVDSGDWNTDYASGGTGSVEVFSQHTSRTVRRFQTVPEAREWIARQRHPNNYDLEDNSGGYGPHIDPSTNYGPVEVRGLASDDVIARFQTEAEADNWVQQQSNPYIYTITDTSTMPGGPGAIQTNVDMGRQFGPREFGPENITFDERSGEAIYPEGTTTYNRYPYDYERTALRQATGTPDPPVEFGTTPTEERWYKDPLSQDVSQAQIDRLKFSAGEGRTEKINFEIAQRRRENKKIRAENLERELRGETPLPLIQDPFAPGGKNAREWDGYGMAQIARVGDGPPGLTIEPTRHQYYPDTPEYWVTWRSDDGKPIITARVEQDRNGWRTIPSLGSNKANRALQGKGFKVIMRALSKMNALEAGGSISDFTARAIAGALKLVDGITSGAGGDASMGGAGAIYKMLENTLNMVKNGVLKGKSLKEFKLKSVDDLVNLEETMSGGDKSVRFWANKLKNQDVPVGPINIHPSLLDQFRNADGAIDLGAPIKKTYDFIKDMPQAIRDMTGISMGEMGRKKSESTWFKELLAVPRNATTMLDLSAPGRQGLPLIFSRHAPQAAIKMFQSLNDGTFQKIMRTLEDTDLMHRPVDANGKEMPSLGDKIGTKMFYPASESPMGSRGYKTASRWLEAGFGEGVGSKIWKHSAGYPIRAFNRGFLAYMNVLNVNRTQFLLDMAKNQAIKGLETGKVPRQGLMGGIHFKEGGNFGFKRNVTPDEALNLNPYHNIPRAKEIADFVNTATGHGPLRTHALPHKGAEVSLESASEALGTFMFAPGLLARNMRMLNPFTYVMATPYVRRQYVKAALSSAAAWSAAAYMIKMTAGDEAEVGLDPLSADFGKVRIGDARMDLSGGFAPFAVAVSRAYVGGSTSSASGQFHRFGSGYQATTNEDMMERFFVNKLDPTWKFAYDVANASQYNPFHVGDRGVQLFMPLFIQDLKEIHKENPELLPFMGPTAFFGGGTQIYGQGESVSKFIDPENDWNVTGGGVRDVMPWNWSAYPGEERNFPWSER